MKPFEAIRSDASANCTFLRYSAPKPHPNFLIDKSSPSKGFGQYCEFRDETLVSNTRIRWATPSRSGDGSDLLSAGRSPQRTRR